MPDSRNRKTQSRRAHKHLTPAEIKALRETLGWTQAQAGEEIGGGPSAFHKYEKGLARPSRAAERLLVMMADQYRSGSAGEQYPTIPDPLQVDAEVIAKLNPTQLTDLLRRLLHCEVEKNRLPCPDIHVPNNINAPDGGEDGRISWEGGLEHTVFLPGRLVVFQVKARKMTPQNCVKELVKNQRLRSIVKEIVSKEGAYILFCSQSVPGQSLRKREQAMSDAIRQHTGAEDARLRFYDATKIADWCNQYPSVCALLRKTKFIGLDELGRKSEYQNDFQDDERLAELTHSLLDKLRETNAVVRIIGHSGIGKTRLLLEFFNKLGDDDQYLRLQAVYIDAGGHDEKTVLDSVSRISGPAVVIVDDCPFGLHSRLREITSERGTRLVTLDYEMNKETANADQYIEVARASDEVIDTLLQNQKPELENRVRSWLVSFSEGFPRIAWLAAQMGEDKNPADVVAQRQFAEKMIYGRGEKDKELLRTAQLVATLGVVDIRQLNVLSKLSGGLDVKDLLRNIRVLQERKIIQQRRWQVSIHPLPLALHLALQQWKEWFDAEQRVLLDEEDIPIKLKVNLAQQLARLGKEKIAQKIAGKLLHPRETFAAPEQLSLPANGEILKKLGEIDPESALWLIKHWVEDQSADESQEARYNRFRSLIDMLISLCWRQDYFERAASLLFNFALAEADQEYPLNEWASRAFAELFLLDIGATEAGPAERLRLLDSLRKERHEKGLGIIVQALRAPLQKDGYRLGSTGKQGGGPDLASWRPATWNEMFHYQKGCLDMLVKIAISELAHSGDAKQAIADSIRYLLRCIPDDVEEAINTVAYRCGSYWPEAMRSLAQARRFDWKNDPEFSQRIEKFQTSLGPSSLEEKIDFIVCQRPHDFSSGDDDAITVEEKQQKKVEELAGSLGRDWHKVVPYLNRLVSSRSHRTFRFGYHLFRAADASEALKDEVVKAVKAHPPGKRNLSLLGGVVRALAKADEGAADRFLESIVADDDLKDELAYFVTQTGITEKRLLLVEKKLARLPAQSLLDWQGSDFNELKQERITSFIDKLFSMSADFVYVGFVLLHRYAFDKLKEPGEFIPQLLVLAEKPVPGFWNKRNKHFDNSEGAYYFCAIFDWLFGQRPKDKDACEAARRLTQCLVKNLASDGYESAFKEYFWPLLPKLLSNFAEVVWPILGNAVVSNNGMLELHQQNISNSSQAKSFLLYIPEEMLISWCESHPKIAPRFALANLPFRDGDRIHPLTLQLIDRFGDEEAVLKGLGFNIYNWSSGWVGDVIDYYQACAELLKQLQKHQKLSVRNWSQDQLFLLEQEIKGMKSRQEERLIA